MKFRKESSKFVKYKIGWETKKYSVFEIAKGTPEEELENIHEYAILSHNVYEEETYSKDWESKDSRVSIHNWTLVKDIPKFSRSPKDKKEILGLYFEVWEKQSSEDEVIFAIVFRGTEDGTDWKSNLRWFTTKIFPHWWDQYHQVQYFIEELIDNLVEKARNSGMTYKIISTGHSLGGGLAQLAAYASDKINLTFAFDPSPVTGFYDISYVRRIINKKDITIYRIYEQGEILAYFRNLMLFLYPAPMFKIKNPRFIQIAYNVLGQKGIASQHNMKLFAKWLTHIKEKESERSLENSMKNDL